MMTNARAARAEQAQSGERALTYAGHRPGSLVYAAHFSPDSRRVVSAGSDRSVQVGRACPTPIVAPPRPPRPQARTKH